LFPLVSCLIAVLSKTTVRPSTPLTIQLPRLAVPVDYTLELVNAVVLSLLLLVPPSYAVEALPTTLPPILAAVTRSSSRELARLAVKQERTPTKVTILNQRLAATEKWFRGVVCSLRVATERPMILQSMAAVTKRSTIPPLAITAVLEQFSMTPLTIAAMGK